ncbi:MAG: class I SAM-dependent methyltransferase, partial [Actinomycetota bacterium]|nr:class I SAM-dependent methyltransferase [Actinomycetota bacterium]
MLGDLADAADEAAVLLARAEAAPGASRANRQGGHVGRDGSRRSLIRHLANYAAAAALAEQHASHGGNVTRGDASHGGNVTMGDASHGGRVLDVGSGVGALGAWLANRLGWDLTLVDADPLVRRVASAAFRQAGIQVHLDAVPDGSAGLVTAMEVVEHVPPGGQRGFVAALRAKVAPGGLLVVSTPDESGYPGGWSGYAPHVGVLDADGLQRLLRRHAGPEATVWRLEGEVFELDGVRRLLHPVVNRVWGRAAGAMPGPCHILGGWATGVLGRVRPGGDVRTDDVRLAPPAEGSGTGLIGVVPVPAA